MNRLCIFLLFNFLAISAFAQMYTIKGRVMDADTKEGLPFSDVYFVGTTIGASTDVDGYYEIQTLSLSDTLAASALGYNIVKKKVKRDSIQTIDFQLSSNSLELQEIVVLAGENPANAIVRGIIKNKERNKLENNNAYQYESYAKVELDLENISPKLRQSKLLKPFEFVFENIDSTSDEKPFLPMYINEVVADVYYAKGKGDPKTILRAQRTSGADNETIIEYIKKIHAPFSIYDNWIYVLEKPFVSPFSDAGLGYYEYYIIDSTNMNGHWSHQLKFKPKRKQENTFFGTFWVADSSFAVQRVDMRMSPDVNINLVQRIIVYQEFQPQGSNWLPVVQKMIVDFIPTKDIPGVIARRTETFKNIVLNHQETTKTYTESDNNYYQQEALERDAAYWEQARHVPLTKNEASVYALVDSIKNVPLYKTYMQIIDIVYYGYFTTGSWEFGPYGSAIGFNPIEGTRFRLGARTSLNFSKKLRFGGYAAYGTKDQEWKYGGDFIWKIKDYPRTTIGGGYKNDISLSSESSEDFLETDFFSGTFRRNLPMKLIRIEEGKFFYEQYWKKGFSNRFTLIHRAMDPYGGLADNSFDYGFLRDSETMNGLDTTINTTELLFKMRFAFEETVIDETFARYSVTTKHPIIEIQYAAGLKGILGGDYNYHRLSLSYKHYLNINPIGWLSYRFEAGKVFGTVPFLLMEVHPGNEGFFMARGIFNLMNRYEFASDTYAQLILEHHFDGFFLNKVPLFRKLNLREVASFKTVIGSISEENQQANLPNLFNPNELDNYNGFRAPSSQPYMELGIGIENILKIFRIDALWRMNYLDNKQANRFGWVGGFYFFF